MRLPCFGCVSCGGVFFYVGWKTWKKELCIDEARTERKLSKYQDDVVLEGAWLWIAVNGVSRVGKKWNSVCSIWYVWFDSKNPEGVWMLFVLKYCSSCSSVVAKKERLGFAEGVRQRSWRRRAESWSTKVGVLAKEDGDQMSVQKCSGVRKEEGAEGGGDMGKR